MMISDLPDDVIYYLLAQVLQTHWKVRPQIAEACRLACCCRRFRNAFCGESLWSQVTLSYYDAVEYPKYISVCVPTCAVTQSAFKFVRDVWKYCWRFAPDVHPNVSKLRTFDLQANPPETVTNLSVERQLKQNAQLNAALTHVRVDQLHPHLFDSISKCQRLIRLESRGVIPSPDWMNRHLPNLEEVAWKASCPEELQSVLNFMVARPALKVDLATSHGGLLLHHPHQLRFDRLQLSMTSQIGFEWKNQPYPIMNAEWYENDEAAWERHEVKILEVYGETCRDVRFSINTQHAAFYFQKICINVNSALLPEHLKSLTVTAFGSVKSTLTGQARFICDRCSVKWIR